MHLHLTMATISMSEAVLMTFMYIQITAVFTDLMSLKSDSKAS